MKKNQISYNNDIQAFTRCLFGCYQQELEIAGVQMTGAEEIEKVCECIASYLIAPEGLEVSQNLIVTGGVGSGKTTLLRAIARTMYLDSKYDFATKTKRDEPNICLTVFKSAKELAMMSKSIGAFPTTLVDYNFFLLVDDVGSEEQKINCYGTVIRLMEDIICMRVDKGMRTILSTNFDKVTLARYYDSIRVADRLKTYNLIELNSGSFRK